MYTNEYTLLSIHFNIQSAFFNIECMLLKNTELYERWNQEEWERDRLGRSWWGISESPKRLQRMEEEFYRGVKNPSLEVAVIAVQLHIKKQREKEMNQELQVKSENTSVGLCQKLGMTEKQLDLVKRTVAKNATDDELELFFYRCKELQLNPLMPGQVYFLKFGNSPGTVIVGLEGFRARAQRTGKLAGIKRGVIRNDRGECIGGWADVYRKDWDHPAHEEVALAEYMDNRKQTWKSMPETMIKKVAEVAALRMAFPEELGGVYAKEEMDRVDQDTTIKNVETHQRTNLKPSEAQLKRLFAIAKSNGFTNEMIKNIFLNNYGHESTKDLTLDEYNELCSNLEAKTITIEKKEELPEPGSDLDEEHKNEIPSWENESYLK